MLPGFCKHAIWLFGVLVGLAIKEAITRVVPHLLVFSDDNHQLSVEALRLLVFGLMIVRHYLGAAYLFDDVHATALEPCVVEEAKKSEEDARLKAAQRQFGVDFFAGLLHFTIFSVWALTLEAHHLDTANTAPMAGAFAFQGTLMFVLFYDVFWLAARPGPHPQPLKFWTMINVVTALVVLISYHIALSSDWTELDAEAPGLVFVAFISVLDIMQLTMNTAFVSTAVISFARWLSALAKFR